MLAFLQLLRASYSVAGLQESFWPFRPNYLSNKAGSWSCWLSGGIIVRNPHWDRHRPAI